VSANPPADVPEPDEPAVRRLLAASPRPELADLPLSFVARGWDNSVWRVGDALAARIPVRLQAVELIENEARWGAELAAPLVALGAAAALPVQLVPAGEHPFPWLLTTWVEGDLLEDVPVEERGPVAAALAAVLPSLHRLAPPDAPVNPFRGRDLADLPDVPQATLDRSRAFLGDAADDLHDVLDAARSAPRWAGPRVWCHGDLHPRNLLLRRVGAGTAAAPAVCLGVLDHGDLTAGDPAVDLGVLWLAFSTTDRDAALATLAPAYDPDVVTRARGWAARFTLNVSGGHPDPFGGTLKHATAQLLG
jgi:aminoglycoside phosphotransferase (APT) family kinase protein